MKRNTRFRVDPDLEEWATNLVKAMGNFALEGALHLGIDNDVRIWYRNIDTQKMSCEILKFYKS